MAKTKADTYTKISNLLEDKDKDELLILLSNFLDSDKFNEFYIFIKKELDIVDNEDSLDELSDNYIEETE